MMPAPAMKPIIEVAVKKAPKPQCPGRMPMSESGMGRRIARGHREGLEPADHEDRDEDQDHRESDAEVPEHFVT